MPFIKEGQLTMEKTPSYFYGTSVPDRIRENEPHAKLILTLCDPVTRSFSDYVHEHYKKYEKGNSTSLANDFDEIVDNFISSKGKFSGTDIELTPEHVNDVNKLDTFNHYFTRGIYYPYLITWMHKFSKSKLLVLNGNEWINDPGGLIERVQDFLQIPKLLLREDFVRNPETGFYCFRRWWGEKFSIRENFKGVIVEGRDGKELFCLSSQKGRTRNGVRSMLNTTKMKLKEFFKPLNEELYNLLNESFFW